MCTATPINYINSICIKLRRSQWIERWPIHYTLQVNKFWRTRNLQMTLNNSLHLERDLFGDIINVALNRQLRAKTVLRLHTILKLIIFQCLIIWNGQIFVYIHKAVMKYTNRKIGIWLSESVIKPAEISAWRHFRYTVNTQIRQIAYNSETVLDRAKVRIKYK